MRDFFKETGNGIESGTLLPKLFSEPADLRAAKIGPSSVRELICRNMLYLIRTPSLVQQLFPGFLWRSEAAQKQLYLTFDDGPVPDITPWVLDLLKDYNALGTFFCVGENVKKYPALYRRILDEGHSVGNHTFNHISGWTNGPDSYMANVSSCANYVDSDLFRPPYGKLGRRQARVLREHRYRIVMWDVLSGDFDHEIDPEKCYRNVIENARPGSIIVFHDSIKARQNLEWALPRTLEHFMTQGYQFSALKSSPLTRELALQKTA